MVAGGQEPAAVLSQLGELRCRRGETERVGIAHVDATEERIDEEFSHAPAETATDLPAKAVVGWSRRQQRFEQRRAPCRPTRSGARGRTHDGTPNTRPAGSARN